MRTRLSKIMVQFDRDIVLARDLARRLSGLLGLGSYDQTAMGTTVSEMIRYIFAKDITGDVEFCLGDESNPPNFIIELHGVNAKTSSQAMETTRTGLELEALRRLGDLVETVPPSGKGVTLRFSRPLGQRIPSDIVEKIRQSVAIREPRIFIEELQFQNHQLIETIENLQKKQQELTKVHDDLLKSNTLLKQANQQLEVQAVHDPLTGLYNRLKYNELISMELQRSRRYGFPLALILFDIDHFKQINDIHGHDQGDKVLVEIADLVGINIREEDMLFRWGGEEFVVLLPHCGGNEGRTAAEKLRQMISQYHFGLTPAASVTCSFGVAVLGEADDRDGLFKKADEALYRAKNSGRNRVEVCWEGSVGTS